MSAPLLTVEVAKIYRAGNRRYFTKRAAWRSLARQMVRARCDCDPGDEITPGVSCRYHEPDHYPALIARLARFLASTSSLRSLTPGVTEP